MFRVAFSSAVPIVCCMEWSLENDALLLAMWVTAPVSTIQASFEGPLAHTKARETFKGTLGLFYSI